MTPIPIRPTVPKWTCRRSGDCCLNVDIRLTVDEAGTMQAATAIPLLFNTAEKATGWLRLTKDGACPCLVREADGSATCSVWDARPYQCRRFQCGRPDPQAEGYEIGGPLGCRNLSDRLQTSAQFAAEYDANQRRAQKWALAHGWQRG